MRQIRFVPFNKLRPTDPDVEKEIRAFYKMNASVIKAGNEYMRRERMRFGGNPAPWEPGGENYFSRRENPNG